MIPRLGPTEGLIICGFCIIVIATVIFILLGVFLKKSNRKVKTSVDPIILEKEISEGFYSKVAGVSHKNDDGSDRQEIIRKYCKPKMPLILQRELENKYDPNATAIYIEVDGKKYQIGYVSSAAARDLRIEKYNVTIKDITGGTQDQKTLGVNILFEPKQESL
jgi:hypothetical protein